jgi:hypothetical protein
MEILNFQRISTMDSPALTAVIEYWTDYDPTSVVFAYGELKKRNYPLPSRPEKNQVEFCKKYNYPDMDSFLKAKLKEFGCESYQEYYEKGISKKLAEEKANSVLVPVNPFHIRAVGRALKDIVWIVFLLTIVLILNAIVIITARTYEVSANWYMIMCVISLAGNISILWKLYSAGNNLEKSV